MTTSLLEPKKAGKVRLTRLLKTLSRQKPDAPSRQEAQSIAAFPCLPYHLEFSQDAIITRIRALRPSDVFSPELLQIHDGDDFVAFHTDQVNYTPYPFLLLRYSVRGGGLRYVTYSTLAHEIEHIVVGSNAEISALIDLYCDSVITHGYPVIARLPFTLIAETPALKAGLLAFDDHINHSLQHMQTCTPDLAIRLLPCGWVCLYTQLPSTAETLSKASHGLTPQPTQSYLQKIEAYFGVAGQGPLVIYSAVELAEWRAAGADSFMMLMAQRIAEHVFPITQQTTSQGQQHSRSVLAALLSRLYTGHYHLPKAEDQHGMNGHTLAGQSILTVYLDKIMRKTAIPALESIRQHRAPSKADLLRITTQSIHQLAIQIDAMQRVHTQLLDILSLELKSNSVQA